MTNHHHVKGSHITHLRALVDAGLGALAFDRTLRELGYEVPARYLPNVWYPLEPALRVLELAAPKLESSVRALAARAAAENAREDVPTIFRLISRLMSPVRLLKAMNNIWSQYVRFGNVVVIKNEAGRFVAEGHDVPERFSEWALGAWQGFLPNAVTIAGGQHPELVELVAMPSGPGTVKLRGELHYRAEVQTMSRGAIV